MQINQCYHMPAEEFLRSAPSDCIDLTVTSPPYDNLRTYNGFSFDVQVIAHELYRVTTPGGVCVWVVADQTVDGSESGTSFRQALTFMQSGWKLYDTMIYRKINALPRAGKRYHQAFEYMFVFSKGMPCVTNIGKRERRNKQDTRTHRITTFSRNPDGAFRPPKLYITKEYVSKDNTWEYYTGGGNSTNDKIAFRHPAIFPEQLAADHIESWTNKGDTVLDIFAGSGTTLKMAGLLGRNYIGTEISSEYCSIIAERLQKYKS